MLHPVSYVCMYGMYGMYGVHIRIYVCNTYACTRPRTNEYAQRVPSPNRYMAVARFCFCKNNKRMIDRYIVVVSSWYLRVSI